MHNALTVDVEDYFHICGADEYWPPSKWTDLEPRVEFNTYQVLELLAAYKARATFFVLGYVAHKYPRMIKDIAAAGHEVGCHGYYHRSILQQTPHEFREDLRQSLAHLQDILGYAVKSYRAPEWTITRKTLWAFEILVEQGICYDSSTVPLTAMGDRTFPDLPYRLHTSAGELLEFPATSMRCLWEHFPYTGGLPLRMSPYWYTVQALRHCNRRGIPAIVYFHPWEFDYQAPPIKLSKGRAFMHFFHMKCVRPKIEGLLQCFDFAPLCEVLHAYLGTDGAGYQRRYCIRTNGHSPGLIAVVSAE